MFTAALKLRRICCGWIPPPFPSFFLSLFLDPWEKRQRFWNETISRREKTRSSSRWKPEKLRFKLAELIYISRDHEASNSWPKSLCPFKAACCTLPSERTISGVSLINELPLNGALRSKLAVAIYNFSGQWIIVPFNCTFTAKCFHTNFMRSPSFPPSLPPAFSLFLTFLILHSRTRACPSTCRSNFELFARDLFHFLTCSRPTSPLSPSP